MSGGVRRDRHDERRRSSHPDVGKKPSGAFHSSDQEPLCSRETSCSGGVAPPALADTSAGFGTGGARAPCLTGFRAHGPWSQASLFENQSSPSARPREPCVPGRSARATGPAPGRQARSGRWQLAPGATSGNRRPRSFAGSGGCGPREESAGARQWVRACGSGLAPAGRGVREPLPAARSGRVEWVHQRGQSPVAALPERPDREPALLARGRFWDARISGRSGDGPGHRRR